MSKNSTDILAISKNNNSASIVTLHEGQITFAGISSRYSKMNSDNQCAPELFADAISAHFTSTQAPDLDVVAMNRKPVVEFIQQLIKQPTMPARDNFGIRHRLPLVLHELNVNYHNNHKSHAASAFQTSTFDDATVIVIDGSIGVESATIWHAYYDKNGNAQYKKLWSMSQKNSIGRMYKSAMEFVGVTDELVFMRLASEGTPRYYNEFKFILTDGLILNADFSDETTTFPYYEEFRTADAADIAATVQRITEDLVLDVFTTAHAITQSDNICYAGGVAQNSKINYIIENDKVWIPPHAGGFGSAIGAAALSYGKRLDYTGPYLGHDIRPGKAYPIQQAAYHLVERGIVGVAHGKTEFSKIALGNRNIYADPRGKKSLKIAKKLLKKDENRVFSVAILAEHLDRYFDMPKNSLSTKYGQILAKCKYPDAFPAVVSADDTVIVQPVTAEDHFGLYMLLKTWYTQTKCPMLMSTSLNAPNKPWVNTIDDVSDVEKAFAIPVVS